MTRHQKYGTESIRYGTLHFRDRRGAASIRHRNRAATIVLMCVNRHSIRYDFNFVAACEHIDIKQSKINFN